MEHDLFTTYSYSEQHLTRSSYDYIYISPHLDDVVLSCSGTLCRQHAQGRNILVVTLFAGEPQPPFSPFVQSVHRSWHATEERPYHVRQQEERKAMALLEVDYAWLDWLEILYRDPALADANDLFCEPGTPVVPSADAALFTKLCAWLAAASHVYPGVQFVVPLGLGMHRDHQCAFRAALTTLDTDRVLFFEDFPYATYYSQDELLDYLQPYHMSALEVDISEYLEQRIAASLLYQSQIPTFFSLASSFPDLIRTYTLQAGKQQHPIERYWRIS